MCSTNLVGECRFLNNSKQLLGETANKSVHELGLIRENDLKVVSSEQPTIEALKMLASLNIRYGGSINVL